MLNYSYKCFPIFSILFLNNVALDLEKLEYLGINNDFYVSDIAVFFNRAFLTIPRTICKNNISHPTFVEVPWKEYNVILKKRINRPIDRQTWANCNDLQNAISLAKESVKSKLWILDKGNEFCLPKLMAFSMFHNSFLDDEKIILKNVPKNGLNSVVIENGTVLGEHRAFIANAGESTILICYLKELVCNNLNLKEKSNPSLPIMVDFLSISKVESKIYLTALQGLQVFWLGTDHIPYYYDTNIDNDTTVSVEYCGDKLGLSSGLETDFKNGLIYYLVRDYAVVRWNTRSPIQAEYHDVLAQSYKRMPYVSRIFSDSQGSIYVLINFFSPSNCTYDNVADNSTENGTEIELERVAKILKYNRLLDVFL